MTIYKPDSTTRGQIEIGDGSKRTKELGGEDNIVINDTLAARLDLQIGDYVIVDGERFVLCEQQQPSMDDTTGGVEYSLKFEAPYKIWRNKSYKLDPANSASEVSWTNTATLKGQVDTFIKNLNARHLEEVAAGYTEFNYRPKVNGSYNNPYTWAIYGEEKLNLEVQEVEVGGVTYKDTVEYKVVNYDNISILEALQAIADAWELEWWIDRGTIYFGRCEIDIDTIDTVAFTEGDNIIGMKPSQSQDEYATRLYAFGGTNNVSGRYRKKLIFTPTKAIQQTWLGTEGYSFRDDPSRMINKSHFDNESKQLPADVIASTYTEDIHDEKNINKLPVAGDIFQKILASNGVAFAYDNYYVKGSITFPNRPGVYKYSASAHIELRWPDVSYIYRWCNKLQGLLYFNNNTNDGIEMDCNVLNGNGSLDLVFSKDIVVGVSDAGKTLHWTLDVLVLSDPSRKGTFEVLYETKGASKGINLCPVLELYFTSLPRISCETVYPFDDNVVLDYDGTDVSAKILPYYDATSSKWSFGFWIATQSTEAYMNPFQIKNCVHLVIPYIDTAFYTSDSESEDVLKSIHEQRLLLPILSDEERTDDGQNPDAAWPADGLYPEYNGGGYIDIFGDLPPSAIVEKTVTLDDVFPKLNLKVSFAGMTEGDKTREDTHDETDESGNKKKVTDIYYRFKAAYEENDNLFILEQQALIASELKVKFLSGNLAGMTFGLELVKGHEGMYEVVRSDDYGVSLPNDSFNPKANDKLIIIGWDTAFYSSKDITAIAEIELLKQVKLIAQGIKADTNVYECPMDTNAAYATGILKIGQTIQLNNPLFFDEDGRASRIIGFTYPLDFPYDNPSYSVGESAKFSRLGNLEANIEGISNYIAGEKVVANTEKKGQTIKLITSDSSVEPTDGNVYSALRTKTEYVSKKEAENFARTDKYTVFHEDVKVEKDLNVENNVTAKNGVFVGSTVEIGGGGIQGAGAAMYEDAEGNSHIEADFLNIRKNATFSQITVAELRHVGGQIALSHASCVIHHVEWYNSNNQQLRQVESERSNVSYYRCYFQAEDRDGNSTKNEWEIGDMARCQIFNYDSTRYYWIGVYRKGTVVVEHTDSYEEGGVITTETIEEKTYHYIDFTTANYIERQVGGAHQYYPSRDTSATDWPEAGDHLAQLGHLWDGERQAAILLSAYSSGAPSFTLYQEVGKGENNRGFYSGNYTLANRAIKQMYYDKTVNHFVEITGKENDPNGNWMKFSKTGLEIHADLYAQGDNMTLMNKLGDVGIIIDGNNRKIRLQADTTEVSNDLMIGGYTYNTESAIPVHYPSDNEYPSGASAVIPTGSKDVIKLAQFNPFSYGYTDMVAWNSQIGSLNTFVTPSLYITPPKMGANVNVISAQVDQYIINRCDHVVVVLPFDAPLHAFQGTTISSQNVRNFMSNRVTVSDDEISIAYDLNAPWVSSEYSAGDPVVVDDEGSHELLNLFMNAKTEAMKYIGSRVIVRNDNLSPYLPVCFFGVKGIMFYSQEQTSPYTITYAEYEPWSRRVILWKLTPNNASIDRALATEAINACRSQLLDANGDIPSSSSATYTVPSGGSITVSAKYPHEEQGASPIYTGGFFGFWSYGKFKGYVDDPSNPDTTEEWVYANSEHTGLMEGDHAYYAPTLTNGEYFCLVCKAENGNIYWEIEDYGTL